MTLSYLERRKGRMGYVRAQKRTSLMMEILNPISSISAVFSFVYRSLYALLNMGTSLDGLIALLVCLQCSCE